MQTISYETAAERHARRLRLERMLIVGAVCYFFGFLSAIAIYVHVILQ